MLETRVMVMQTAPGLAWVRALESSSCEACEGRGCGSSKLGQLFCSQPRQFQVRDPLGVAIGDEVVIAVAEGSVLRGIALVYLLPLLLLLLGATTLHYATHSDLLTALGAGVGLLLGFVLAKWLSTHQGTSLPSIARKV